MLLAETESFAIFIFMDRCYGKTLTLLSIERY